MPTIEAKPKTSTRVQIGKEQADVLFELAKHKQFLDDFQLKLLADRLSALANHGRASMTQKQWAALQKAHMMVMANLVLPSVEEYVSERIHA